MLEVGPGSDFLSLTKGYLVAEYEINVPFEDFKESNGSSGSVECVPLSSPFRNSLD